VYPLNELLVMRVCRADGEEILQDIKIDIFYNFVICTNTHTHILSLMISIREMHKKPNDVASLRETGKPCLLVSLECPIKRGFSHAKE
jgi:hypothetical protein